MAARTIHKYQPDETSTCEGQPMCRVCCLPKQLHAPRCAGGDLYLDQSADGPQAAVEGIAKLVEHFGPGGTRVIVEVD